MMAKMAVMAVREATGASAERPFSEALVYRVPAEWAEQVAAAVTEPPVRWKPIPV
jgi:hypothetical protein